VTEHPYVPTLAAREGHGGQRRTDDASCRPADLVESDLVEVDLTEPDLTEADLAEADLAEAARLISDVVALVDAGFVVVRPRVFGPARYEAVSNVGGAAGSSPADDTRRQRSAAPQAISRPQR
jgi:Pentapeptide repeats (8 copies)